MLRILLNIVPSCAAVGDEICIQPAALMDAG